MEDWTDIRERVASGKVSKRAILRETGMHWKTLKKILTHSEPLVNVSNFSLEEICY